MINLDKINYSKLAPFRFKKIGKDYLLTNEIGEYIFLNPRDFNKYLQGKSDKESIKYIELLQKNFISDKIDNNKYTKKYFQKYNYLFQQGPSLHIIVTTLRCDHRCIYCQTSSKRLEQKEFDMNIPTAKKVVNFIFSTSSPWIRIEFQGGEPLLNWPVLKYIVNYALALNKTKRKNLQLSLVSNFTLLDEQKIKFLAERGVGLCTSLDGPEKLHNFNRRFLKGNSYQAVILGLKKLQGFLKRQPLARQKKLEAIVTVSRYSLKYPKEIVDEYLKLGFESIFVRPAQSLGLDKETWQKIGFSPTDYLKFYKKLLDYIIKLNLKGEKIRELKTKILLEKILTNRDPDFLDLRSPCGAVLGQLAYHYNGDIYTCDEGRMLAEKGDFNFRLGNVNRTKYGEVIEHSTTKVLALASCLDGLPECCDCAWKPYCGVCPLDNHKRGNIYAKNNDSCQIKNGMFQLIFERLKDEKAKSVFLSWLD